MAVLTPELQRIIDAGVALAYNPKAQGIVAVWVEYLRRSVKVSDEGGRIKTAAVNADGVFFAPAFLAKLDREELQFLVAHETLHLALDIAGTAQRLGITHEPEKRRLLNIAQDAVINDALSKDRIGKFPDPAGTRGLRGVLLDDLRAQGYTGLAETTAVYYWLLGDPSKAPPPPPSGGKGQPGQGEPGEGDPAEGDGALKGCGPSEYPSKDGKPRQKPEAGQGEANASGGQPEAGGLSPVDVAKALATLRELSAQAGTGSALGDMLRPAKARTSYKDIVRAGFERAAMSARNRTDPTYARAGRRPGLDGTIITSGRTGREAKLVFIGDVSGSISRDLVEKLQGHCLSLAREFPDVRVLFITHTDRVEFCEWLKEGGDEAKVIEGTARSGGTDFAPAYDAARERGRFDALVHFTDGYNFREWPEPPAKQTIVALCGGGVNITTPPVGARIIPVREG